MPQLRGRLPGVAPRLFIARRGNEDTLEEVALGLTTVWFFPHRELAVLIHHGSVDITEEDGRDVARLVLGADFRGAMRPAEHFRSVMMARLILEFPISRSTKVIGTSTTLSPARTARQVRSTWKQ